MEKITNIEFESLLQNDEFIHLMNGNHADADLFIDDLCAKNPEKEESIRLAVKLVRHYQREQMDFDDESITEMWNTIHTNSELKKGKRSIRLKPALRIAASILIIVSFAFFLYQYTKNNSIGQFANKKIEVSNEAKLIISDGTEVKLKTNESHIRYDAEGNQIVIEENNNKTEKLENHNSQKEEYNQVVVPYGRKHSLTLCDGTTVQLNSGSSLVFPARFTGKKREVFLKGEGYFDVAKNTEKPFIVNTESINIKVTGTKFNVSAYENENSISTVLVEGSVEVATNGFFSSNRRKIAPGQGCFFTNNSDELSVREVDINQYISWLDGQLQFKDQSLTSLIKKVEKFYNQKVVVNDDELANRIISGKLVLSEKLEETLDFLAKTTKSRYIKINDGSYLFTKQ